jgi:hypothetical protein
MILQLANRHCKKIAGFYLFVFCLSIVLPLGARSAPVSRTSYYGGSGFIPKHGGVSTATQPSVKPAGTELSANKKEEETPLRVNKAFIGGPSQPEMASFKSVSADKLVNLFTGDFSYNIPLLDVGGYPINIYYNGGISPDQEASWVGLGWNINPGNINRNMRGIPDDFNGKDILIQEQKMKPNKTWGASVGAGVELLGIKLPVTLEVGAAFNNYLGPSLDVGIRGSANLFKASVAVGSEKSVELGLAGKLNFGVDINSRAGTSFSGGLSLNASVAKNENSISAGIGASTGYNSRSGIKALTITGQASFNQSQTWGKGEDAVNKVRSIGGSNYTSITFAKPSYTPILRMPVTNTAWTARVQIGAGSFGLAADIEAEVFRQKSEIAPSDVTQSKPMVGYLYYQEAENRPDHVMDFTRYNDREVTPNTKVISVPQYSYDVFAIQGEGTGGNIRAYRNDLGYVRDNVTTSKDKNVSGGGDVDLPGHFGANFTVIKTPSTIGEWKNGNHLRGITSFSKAKSAFGNVYFRNPGEATVSRAGRYDNIGGTKLVRYELGGSGQSPTIEPVLQFFDGDSRPARGTGAPTSVKLTNGNNTYTASNSRTQIITFLNAEEADKIGLDRYIKMYDNKDFLNPATNTLKYDSIKRYDGVIRKMHHISQINVTESDGKRYVYGVPVYNIKQKDFTFSVDGAGSNNPELVNIQPSWATTGSPLVDENGNWKGDGYVQITTTPAYAHSFLLSGILSPDYVDVTNNGITEDDLGTAVKFNYTKIQDGDETVYKWRTPHTDANTGNFNAGNRSEMRDDKALISYGERESWYLSSVESKNMIALFYVKPRVDGKGAASEYGGKSSSGMLKALDKIELYSKADLVKNGTGIAKPIKTVHFDYTYELCKNTPDNRGATDDKGKLTLKSIYFAYNGQEKKKGKNRYSFSYGENPDYFVASADRWGTYKPAAQNPEGLKNSDFPYSIQDKTTAKNNAGAWSLKSITLPSGGKIEVEYESDDYAWVQNKRAAAMMNVVGFGSTSSFKDAGNKLYPYPFPSDLENNYVFIRVPEACHTPQQVKEMYLQGMTQLAFKIWVNMPKGPEYIPCYANIGEDDTKDFGVDDDNDKIIWVKMQTLGGKSPLSMTTLEYLRQQLPGQAFKGYDIAGDPALKQVGDMLMGMIQGLRDAFTDPVNAFRKDGKAQHVDLSKCFVRLNVPLGFKYGGGHRVRSVTLNDNWNAMTGQYAASYGQVYNYTTTEKVNGVERTISSGVASYEPSIGGEENPWQSILNIEDELPLGPTSYGAIEMPVLDAFFPAPVVGYSNVSVTSIHAGLSGDKKRRSGIGRQVTEFYTAKDYPVSYNYTPFDGSSVKEFHQNSTKEFLTKYGYDYKAQSQGFLIATNDMHGKMRSQTSYAESEPKTVVNYTENFYRNTGVNGLNEQFTFIDSYNHNVFNGNMGVDIELMTDVREFSVKGTSREHQGNVDIFFILGVPVPIPTYWQINGTTENIYRAVTATKVINYHAVLDRVVVIDKGSQVETQNLAYDAETGQAIVTRTNNEFNMPVYNTTYPAYWAYSGMGPASANIDATYSNVDFIDGKVVNKTGIPFESGDELYIIHPGNAISCPSASSADTKLIWAVDKNKNNSSISSVTPDLVFIDGDGLIYNRANVTFRVIRSGHRNMLAQSIANIVSMDNPIASGTLSFANATRVINASAVEYREKWQTDNDQFKRYRQDYNSATCVYTLVEDPTAFLQKNINPYRKGLLGNFHAWRTMVFYDDRKENGFAENDDKKEHFFTEKTKISQNGFLKNFKPYWIKLAGYMLPDVQNKQWVWNSKLNRINTKGLELETMDPLGIYTSAQYGYNKTIPVAITNNAQYEEMFAEGFEDYGYGESLYGVQYNSQAKRHVDFNNLQGISLVPADTRGFKAHSGKCVLSVDKGATATAKFDLRTASTLNNPLAFSTTVTRSLQNLGSNFDYFDKDVTDSWTITSHPGPAIRTGDNLEIVAYQPQSWQGYGASIGQSQYFEVVASGYYSLYMWASTSNFMFYVSTSINISNIDGSSSVGYATTLPSTAGGESAPPGYETRSNNNVWLCKGIYLLQSTYTVSAEAVGPPPDNRRATFGFSLYSDVNSNTLFNSYRDYSTVNGCVYTLPMEASESMLNPVFGIPADKKMFLSAWVRETCGDAANGIPCKEYTYTHSQVMVKFPNSPAQNVIMKPVGPIIDGWQRIEGEFTTPQLSLLNNVMELSLVNSSSNPVYFDDIRIHPYNANMKSYVYDPVNLRLTAELDANNYATFYEYNEEGTLIRTKVETKEGIKTVTETRSALQKLTNQ